MTDDGYVLLVTDRLDRGESVADALGVAVDVRVVGPDFAPVGPNDLSGVRGIISDINMSRRESVSSLRAAIRQARLMGDKAAPLTSMLRGSATGEEGFLRAKHDFGADMCLPSSTPPRKITAAVVAQAYPGESVVDRIVNRGLSKSGAAVGSLMHVVDNGGVIDMPTVNAGVDPVINAIRHGGLARWLDSVWVHDDTTYQHCLMVAGLAAAIALDLRFPEADLHRFLRAALMHDLGKSRIPLEILNKPGKLTDEERAVMKTHAQIGHDILVAGGVSEALTLDTALHHHEMLDGTGYPDRLHGDGISNPVRLMTVCDIYAALIEKRPYKDAATPEEAFGILKSMGSRLEQSMVDALARAVLKPTFRAAA